MGLVIRLQDGVIEFLYDDKVRKLLTLGQPTVERASYVDPHPTQPGRWVANLTPIGGPVLGQEVGFESRNDAILSEIEWIESHYLRNRDRK